MGFLAPVVGGLAAGVAGGLFNKAFGPKPPRAPIPGSVFAPGLELLRSGNSVNVTRTGALDSLFGRLGGLAKEQGAALTGLLGQVRPGFSALRQSRLAGLENTRRRAIGDLRENLARRRIAGSSFAFDALNRAELGFQEEADRIRAESFLQELDTFNRILTQRHETLSSDIQAQISQTNLEAQLGANFANGVQATLTNIFNTQSQLAAQGAAGLGAFFQPAISGIQSGVSNAFSNFFGGGGGTPVNASFNFAGLGG